jgi:hypothetical protein
MQKYFAQRGLPGPNKEMARECCLGKEVKAPDLTTLKDFLRFQASTMRGKIMKEVKTPTNAFLNDFVECFFAGFTRMTGTEVGKTERSEIYKMGLATNSFGR